MRLQKMLPKKMEICQRVILYPTSISKIYIFFSFICVHEFMLIVAIFFAAKTCDIILTTFLKKYHFHFEIILCLDCRRIMSSSLKCKYST